MKTQGPDYDDPRQGHATRETVSYSRPSTSRDQVPVSVDDWLSSLPDIFEDSREGLVGDLIPHIKRLFREVHCAAAGRPGHKSLLKQQQLFHLWADGSDNLDRKVSEVPDGREILVSNLAALALLLSQGVPPKFRPSVLKETRELIRQASKTAHDQLEHAARFSPLNFTEFLDLAERFIQSRVQNLHDLSNLSTKSDRPSDKISKSDDQHAQQSGFSQNVERMAGWLKKRGEKNNDIRVFEMISTLSQSPAPSVSDTEGSGRAPASLVTPITSDSSKNGFDHLADQDSEKGFRLRTDTDTSSSRSQAGHSNSEPNIPSLGPTLLRCYFCQDTFKDHEDAKRHFIRHLRPYHCCSNPCKEGHTLCETPQQWANHEFETHRINWAFKCTYCPKGNVSFDLAIRLRNHLAQEHAEHIDSDKLRGMEMDQYLTKTPRPIQDEQCDFCGFKSFSTVQEFVTHMCEHMEQACSAIFPEVFVRDRQATMDILRWARSCAPIFLSHGFVNQRQTFLIWDGSAHQQSSHDGILDTGTEDNLICSSVVEKLGLEVRPLLANEAATYISMGSRSGVEASGFVQPEWSIKHREKRHKAVSFMVVPSIVDTVEIVLGSQFMNDNNIKLHAPMEALVIHRCNKDTDRKLYNEDKQRHKEAIRQAEKQKNTEALHAAQIQGKAAQDRAFKDMKSRESASQAKGAESR